MKKIFTMVAFAGLASFAYAAPVTCTAVAVPPDEPSVLVGAVNQSPITFTCPLGSNNVNGDNLDITSLTFILTGAMSNANGPAGTYGLTVTATGHTILGGGAFVPALACTASALSNALGLASNICSVASSVAVAGLPDSVGPFTVTVTGTIPGGQLTPNNGSTSLVYDQLVTPRQTSVVPEPGSMALLGSGLLGLGLLARRRRK